MAGAADLELAQRGGCASDCLGGAAGERPVPVRDGIWHEGLEAERPAVAARAIAAPFPQTVNELRQRSDPLELECATKGTALILS